jgi:hypothetical protein
MFSRSSLSLSLLHTAETHTHTHTHTHTLFLPVSVIHTHAPAACGDGFSTDTTRNFHCRRGNPCAHLRTLFAGLFDGIEEPSPAIPGASLPPHSPVLRRICPA